MSELATVLASVIFWGSAILVGLLLGGMLSSKIDDWFDK